MTGSRAPAKTDLWHDPRVYLSAIRRRKSTEEGFPWTIPLVAGLDALEFD
jgi:hypothetical protein